MKECFKILYNFDTLRVPARIQFKFLKNNDFWTFKFWGRHISTVRTTYIEGLPALENDQDQSNHVLWTVLLSFVEGADWALRAQAKQEIDKDCPKIFEALADSL